MVATLAPLTVEALDAELTAWQASLAGPSSGLRAQRAELRALHDLLARAAVLLEWPPQELAARLGELVGAASAPAVAALAPRPRIVLRLVAAGAADAAWLVLRDNAAGLVAAPRRQATAAGAPRASGRRPLRVLVEAPRVFARLPGFRDPRHAAPDHCYDVSDAVTIRHQLDEAGFRDGVLTLAGWAALDLLACRPDEALRLRLRRAGTGLDQPVRADELVVAGQRRRRSDLVTARDDATASRAWAGWAVDVDVAALSPGTWLVVVELDHCGVSRRAAIGDVVGEYAAVSAHGEYQAAGRSLRWDTSGEHWRLIVAADAQGR
jgi:hypothetical protein